MPGFTTNVTGVSFRQDAVEQCMAGDDVELVREPNNKHDKNAIRVDSDQGQLGYIPSATAAKLAPYMDAGHTFDAFIEKITGGTADKPTLGVILHVRAFSHSESADPEGLDSEELVGGVMLLLCILGGIVALIALFKC